MVDTVCSTAIFTSILLNIISSRSSGGIAAAGFRAADEEDCVAFRSKDDRDGLCASAPVESFNCPTLHSLGPKRQGLKLLQVTDEIGSRFWLCRCCYWRPALFFGALVRLAPLLLPQSILWLLLSCQKYRKSRP